MWILTFLTASICSRVSNNPEFTLDFSSMRKSAQLLAILLPLLTTASNVISMLTMLASLLYLPNYGPADASSTLSSDFQSLQHLFPTTEQRPSSSGLLTNDSGEPSSYIQTILNGHTTDSLSGNQQRRSESSTLTRRGRRS
jgi:hypothetical protein